MTHEELLLTPEYYTTGIQLDLYNLVENYLEENKMTRTELAKKLGVSKGYISQVLNGDFDHRLSKLVELALAVGYKPKMVFEPVQAKKMDECELIEKTIAEAQENLHQMGYSAMIYKSDYNASTCKGEDMKNLKIIA